MCVSAEREQHYRFTEPFLIRHQALFGRRGQPELESLDELANVRVAVQRAGLASEALHEQAGNDVTLLELDTASGTLVAVDRGEADYALAPTGIGYYTINRNALHDVIALSPPLLERKYVFAVPRARRPGAADRRVARTPARRRRTQRPVRRMDRQPQPAREPAVADDRRGAGGAAGDRLLRPPVVAQVTPPCHHARPRQRRRSSADGRPARRHCGRQARLPDRKSTSLNSSH